MQAVSRTSTSNRRRVLGATAAALTAVTLAGCAGWNMLTSQVTTFGTWPAERQPGSFAFDRLPSQQVHAKDQDAVEQMALPGLTAAGFVPAAPGTQADVLVQIGARFDRQDRSPWDDPLWVRPWGPRWVGTPWAGPFWRDYALRNPGYSREVAVLIRDRSSGEALYEARASSDGTTQGGTAIFTAMFSAALKGFPAVQSEPHDVTAGLPG